MQKPKVCILRSAGTNCDKETAAAFSLCGAQAEFVHINSLARKENSLNDYQILALCGGFSYGDDVASGKIFANELKYKLNQELKDFISAGKLIIGICNGFQILVKSGLLPDSGSFAQKTSLIINDSGKFEDRWVYLKPAGKCVWTSNLPEIIYLPIAHGEGKFVVEDNSVLEKLKKNNQIVFSYCDERGNSGGYPYNPNGSLEDIAGICDETGRILGLMPHPERHVIAQQHPRWTENRKQKTENRRGDGLQIFKNGVEYALKNLS